MKSTFQTILLIFFGAVFFIAILVFSGIVPLGSSTSPTQLQGHVTVWGVVPQESIRSYIDEVNGNGLGYTVNYEEHAPANFNQDLIVALANGTPPDVLLLNSEIFSQFSDKLYTVPFASYNERTYRDANIDGAQVFLTKDGIAAFPLVVDPLVVYYNKDLLASKNYVVPPKTWNGLTQSIPLFLKRSKDGSILQTAIALGESSNVNHTRDILSALFLQTGNSIVSYDPTLNRKVVTLVTGAKEATDTLPTAQALQFYSDFSNPTGTLYSWNRSLPNSLDMFLSGRSAFYIGRASELFTLQAQNPNLNFDVFELFQPDVSARHVTFGSFLGVAVLKNAPNFTAAYSFASNISSETAIDTLSKTLSLPPVRRNLLLIQQNNPYVSVFFQAALNAFAWPDPDPNATEQIFRAMISNVSSGKLDPQAAIYDGTRNLQSIVR